MEEPTSFEFKVLLVEKDVMVLAVVEDARLPWPETDLDIDEKHVEDDEESKAVESRLIRLG
jgi:hypothetical protein